MKTIQITNDLLNKTIENKPSRFDMAINFYCSIKKDNKYYLVAYYYNPTWNLYFPFYDDKNKTPILQDSNANTFQELINETNQIIDIDLEDKLYLAHKRFAELIGCSCETKQSKVKELYELKYSKTTNLYSIYKLYNFIITKVEDIKTILNPKNLQCKLFDLENLNKTELVSNAIWFCNEALDELKQNALVIK